MTERYTMAIQLSDETKVMNNPERYAIDNNPKLLTFIKTEPPTGFRGKKANPLIDAMYADLLVRRDQWAHVNITITSASQRVSLVNSFVYRAKKDNLTISSRSMYNKETQVYDVWIRLNS